MRLFVAFWLSIVGMSAYGAEGIHPEDLQQSAVHKVRTFEVDWSKSLSKAIAIHHCDGIVTDRILVLLTDTVPYEMEVRKLEVNYRGFARGEILSGIAPWRQDEADGTKRLLFRDLQDVYLIFRHGRSEYRLIVVSSC